MALSNAQWFANPGVTYEIDNSCRFDGSSSYMTKTFASAGNLKTWTQSFWMKRSEISGSASAYLLNTANGANTGSLIMGNDTFQWMHGVGGGYNNRNTTQVFRDPGAWMHIVIQLDTTQASEPNRSKLWVNGEQVTAFSTETTIDENATTYINDDEYEHGIGRNEYDNNQYFSGYLAEFIFIDGTALDADSFGETNSTTGQWVPKDPSGVTFGSNGFWLDFANSSALGNDVSGNDQDWTTSGLAAADQMTDSPTDNFCLWNAVGQGTSTGGSNYSTLSNGNLVATASGTDYNWSFGTIKPSSGKWYWEITLTTDNGSNWVGVAQDLLTDTAAGDDSGFGSVNGFGYRDSNGNKINDSGTSSSYGATYTAGDVIGVAMDLDNGKIWFSKDGTYQDSGDPAAGSDAAFTTLSGSYAPCIQQSSASAVFTANFGQSSFSTAAPTGFSALSTANLADPTIKDPSAYFQTTLYTGNGSTQSIDQGGNSTFEPDFVWIKNRSAADNHQLFDSARGVTKVLISNDTDAEVTDDDTLTAFDSDGFSLGDDDKVNTNTENYVAWQWLESSTAGFDIGTGTGSGGQTAVSHNLGVVPNLIMWKSRDATSSWFVWSDTFSNLNDNTLFLDTNAATATSGFGSLYGTQTSSQTSILTSGVTGGIATGDDFVVYVWAEVESFSKFGVYTGNGSTDGPFVHTGFKPRFLMTKRTSATEEWTMRDSARSGGHFGSAAGTGGVDPTGGNGLQLNIAANLATEEEDNSTGSRLTDFLANGFKLRHDNTAINADGSIYLWMAFAESPFKYATAR